MKSYPLVRRVVIAVAVGVLAAAGVVGSVAGQAGLDTSATHASDSIDGVSKQD